MQQGRQLFQYTNVLETNLKVKRSNITAHWYIANHELICKWSKVDNKA